MSADSESGGMPTQTEPEDNKQDVVENQHEEDVESEHEESVESEHEEEETIDTVLDSINKLIDKLPATAQHTLATKLASKLNVKASKVPHHQQKHSTAAGTSHSSSSVAFKKAKATPKNTSDTTPKYYGNVAEAPRLPTFSGEKTKGDVTYSLWMYDVLCMKEEKVPVRLILQAIRRSVRGLAADLLQNLGTHVTVDKVLHEFNTVFGDVCSSEQLMQDFYNAKQSPDEDVAQWGCRLLQLAKKAADAGAIPESDFDEKMRNKFFNGLADAHMKLSLRHRFDDIHEDYHSLLLAARAIACEEKGASASKKSAKVSQVTTSVDSKLDEMLHHIKQLESRLGKLEESSSKKLGTGYCHECGDPSHYRPKCPIILAKKEAQKAKQSNKAPKQQKQHLNDK